MTYNKNAEILSYTSRQYFYCVVSQITITYQKLPSDSLVLKVYVTKIFKYEYITIKQHHDSCIFLVLLNDLL